MLGETNTQSTKYDVFPHSIDVNPTAKCNLRCSFCWGPEKEVPALLSTKQWKDVLDFFVDGGTQSVVFTGGEPLIRDDIGELIQYAKEQGLRTTLSTNAILLPQRADAVLPYLDEIGIPIDGSTSVKNQLMRLGTIKAFDRAVAALGTIARRQPNIEVTVRTVVSKVNKEDIVDIGRVVWKNPEQVDRWKLYQFAPVNAGERHDDEHEITQADFDDIAGTVKRTFSNRRIRIYGNEERTGRYIFVGPEGAIHGINNLGKNEPIGNLLSEPLSSIAQRFGDVLNVDRNTQHATEQQRLMHAS